ncbi:hypothetical protein NDU88_005984 [Pleurodeles waltl]|uniref:Uncharacterized protein n=1 Tax=Pleurodeles waltl TaxID=8319 RepID=A0AAV7WWA0_PLEWA|nr:hypothetical protein NDU88_005984 [Pleurodeles waltl]
MQVRAHRLTSRSVSPSPTTGNAGVAACSVPQQLLAGGLVALLQASTSSSQVRGAGLSAPGPLSCRSKARFAHQTLVTGGTASRVAEHGPAGPNLWPTTFWRCIFTALWQQRQWGALHQASSAGLQTPAAAAGLRMIASRCGSGEFHVRHVGLRGHSPVLS